MMIESGCRVLMCFYQRLLTLIPFREVFVILALGSRKLEQHKLPTSNLERIQRPSDGTAFFGGRSGVRSR